MWRYAHHALSVVVGLLASGPPSSGAARNAGMSGCIVRRDLSYVDVHDALVALDLRNVRRSGDEIDFSCPSGNHAHGDANPSARMNARTGLGICHGCGWRGDLVDLIAMKADITQSQAQRVLEERYGGPERSVEAGGLSREVERIMVGEDVLDEDRIAPVEDWVEWFRVDWFDHTTGYPSEDYLIERGFDPVTLTEWQVGYDAHADRIAIPVRDEHGVLVGFKGRAWRPDHKPKYLILGDAVGRTPRYNFNTYHKSRVVYGLYRVGKNANVICCEGELNVLALSQLGIPAIAVAGSEFSERQAQLIIERCSAITVYLDGDDAGRHGTAQIVSALEPYMPVSVVLDAPGDAADLWEKSIPLIANAVPSLIASIDLA